MISQTAWREQGTVLLCVLQVVEEHGTVLLYVLQVMEEHGTVLLYVLQVMEEQGTSPNQQHEGTDNMWKLNGYETR